MITTIEKNKEEPIRLVKVNDEYSEEILGTWEGHCTSEGSEFDDGQEHRWEFKDDGTYVYYVKDGDNWVRLPRHYLTGASKVPILSRFCPAGHEIYQRFINIETVET